MPKLSRRNLSEDKAGLYVEEFWRAVTLLGTKEEVRLFFRDLFTPTERIMLAKRLQIAKLLISKADYAYIRRELSVSNETIASVARSLNVHGEGYNIAFQRLESVSRAKKVKLPKVLNMAPSAKLLAGGIALAGMELGKIYKKNKRRRSAKS